MWKDNSIIKCGVQPIYTKLIDIKKPLSEISHVYITHTATHSNSKNHHHLQPQPNNHSQNLYNFSTNKMTDFITQHTPPSTCTIQPHLNSME